MIFLYNEHHRGKFMRSKLLFFDVDGTLVDGNRGILEIPEGVIHELKRIQKQGHKILICSGRPCLLYTSTVKGTEKADI